MITLALVPAAWVVLLTPLGVGASYLQRRVGPVKTVYNVAHFTTAAGVAAAITVLGGAERPMAGRDVIVLVAAGAAAGVVTYLAVAAVISAAQGVPLLATWKESAGLQVRTLAGNLGIAVTIVQLAHYQAWTVIALPVVVLSLHQAYEGRLRGHQERDAGQRHAAAVGRLTADLDEPGVLRRSAEEACSLVKADAVDVQLVGRSGGVLLYRHHREGKPWIGEPSLAPPMPARIVATFPILAGELATAGKLTVWLASSAPDLRLDQAEEAALHSLALHTGVAVVNARRHAQELYYATHDPVSGLPNRRALIEQVAAIPADRAGTPRAKAESLATLELAGYQKLIRDGWYGRAESLIAEVARRLRDLAGDGEWVAHLGADSFVVLFTGDASADPAHVRERVRRMVRVASRPVELAEVDPARVDARAGITYRPNSGADAEELLRQAMMALNRARELRQPLEFYDEAEDPVGSSYALVLASEMAAALDGNQLELRFQPIASLPDGVPLAVEAVVRWHHPTRGLMEASEFIPTLVRNPVHTRYVTWLLRKALGARASLPADRDLPISVNVASQCVLNPGFPGQVAAALERAEVPGNQLIIELEEDDVLGDAGTAWIAEGLVAALRRQAVGVAIDNFGTGSGSIRYLRFIEATHLKIAPQFTADMLTDDDAETVVRVAMDLGRGYGLEVVAVGVLTDEHVAALTGMGCHAAQARASSTLTGPELLRYLDEAPTHTPAGRADVIAIDTKRRTTPS